MVRSSEQNQLVLDQCPYERGDRSFSLPPRDDVTKLTSEVQLVPTKGKVWCLVPGFPTTQN